MRGLIVVFWLGLICTLGCTAENRPLKEEKVIPQTTTKSITLVYPDDPNIQFLGRWDKKHPLTPTAAYSATGFRTYFFGDTLALAFFNKGYQKNKFNYLAIYIDDVEYPYLKITNSDSVYAIAGNLSDAYHKLEVRKRTESNVGKVTFKGMLVRADTTLQKPNPKKYFFEFVGNSITCGYGSEISVDDPKKFHFKPENENVMRSFASLTAKHFDADYHVVAYSGLGITRDYAGNRKNNMLKMYPKILPDDFSSRKDDSVYTNTDIVVVNLGTNDFISSTPNSSKFINDYLKLLFHIREKHPKSIIVCTGGTMISNTYPAGRHYRSMFKDLILEVEKEFVRQADPYITHFFFEPHSAPYGEDWHPSKLTHQKMANELIEFLKELRDWH